MSEQQKIVIIAGPNGAGKTTFASEFRLVPTVTVGTCF
jgi:ABC-type Mn2+/Zn2+ transport system ATPase subunit